MGEVGQLMVTKGPFTWKEDDPSASIILGLGSSERIMFSGCIWPQC